MFGISFPEILVIAIIAVLVLGPEKLPDTMVQIAKFFKTFKKSINDAKSTFDQEIKIAELKEDAKKYKENIESVTQNVRKKLTFEELDDLKKGVSDVTSGLSDAADSAKKAVEAIKDPTKAIKDSILESGTAQNSENSDKKEA